MTRCAAVYVLWQGGGDSIEVQCALAEGHEDKHEAEVDGEASILDADLSVQQKGALTWPIP